MPRDMRSLVSDASEARSNSPRNIHDPDGTRVSAPPNECFQCGRVGGPIRKDSHPLQNLDLSNVTLRVNCQSIDAGAAYFGESILARYCGIRKIREGLLNFGAGMENEMNGGLVIRTRIARGSLILVGRLTVQRTCHTETGHQDNCKQ